MPPKRLDRQLTDVELELMQLIWRLGECTIRDVFEALPPDRDLAYTTVATMVKILEQKGAVSCQRKERAITVKPRVARAEYEAASLKHLSENVFQGNAGSMAMRLLDESELSEEELRALRKLVDERLRS
jgi:predicted transcriptional regulator